MKENKKLFVYWQLIFVMIQFAYSPICTWDSFPPIIYTERERILPVLKEWEHKDI